MLLSQAWGSRAFSRTRWRATEAGALAVVLEPFEPAPVPVNLVHAGQGLLPLKLRAFVDFAAPSLRAGLLRRRP